MVLHVIFEEGGIPAWIGDESREGAEAIKGVDLMFLAQHRRTPDGDWVRRDPPPPPTEKEIADQEAQRAAIRKEEQARRAEEREERFEKRAIGLLIKRVGGEITQAQFNTRIADLRARLDAEG